MLFFTTFVFFMCQQEKDEAIVELESRWALMSAPSTPGSGGELETRLQELTESLIEKQTLLETMSSEKHSLQIQLENTKSELEKKEASLLVQQNKESVVISGLDDAEHKGLCGATCRFTVRNLSEKLLMYL